MKIKLIPGPDKLNYILLCWLVESCIESEQRKIYWIGYICLIDFHSLKNLKNNFGRFAFDIYKGICCNERMEKFAHT